MDKVNTPPPPDMSTDPGIVLKYGGLPLLIYLPCVIGIIIFCAVMLYLYGG